MKISENTIVALITPPGMGAVATVRVSGDDAIDIVTKIWRGRPLAEMKSHTVKFGTVTDSDGRELDQAVLTLFRAPNSFTGEDVIEISIHGSRFIQQSLLKALIDSGAQPAQPGEFSRRAFLNNKIDLAQAEGIADLISSQSAAAHHLALSQTKGRFSKALEKQRQKLVELAAMLELELDFSEEDVEFADRGELRQKAVEIRDTLNTLADSYSNGQAIRDGLPVAIVGAPNAGKSTLLNTLLNDDLAIVSDIPGTTRDAIQATTVIGPHLIRFIDTAGLRNTDDTVENLGIDRTLRHIANAKIIIWLLDPKGDAESQLQRLEMTQKSLSENQKLIIIIGKSDLITDATTEEAIANFKDFTRQIGEGVTSIDSRTRQGILPLIEVLTQHLDTGRAEQADIIVTNARHYDALRQAAQALDRTIEAIDAGLTADLITLDLRQATHHLGLITGTITTDTLLTHIFSHFCIGK